MKMDASSFFRRAEIRSLDAALATSLPPGGSARVAAMAFSRDGRYLISTAVSGSVGIVDVSQSNPGRLLDWQIDLLPTAVAISNDGRLVSVGTDTGTIFLDEAGRTGSPLTLPPQHTDCRVRSLEFSNDAALLLSGAHDDTAVIWDVATRKMRNKPLNEHAGSVRCAVFSPDDRLIATGSGDNTALIWDTEKQRIKGQRLARHNRPIISLAFSPDSQMLASNGEDGKVVIWDVPSTHQLGEPFTVSSSSLSRLKFLRQEGRALLRLAAPSNPTQQWDLTISALEEQCRLRANRNMTREEWALYIGKQEYRPTWSSLPEPGPGEPHWSVA